MELRRSRRDRDLGARVPPGRVRRRSPGFRRAHAPARRPRLGAARRAAPDGGRGDGGAGGQAPRRVDRPVLRVGDDPRGGDQRGLASGGERHRPGRGSGHGAQCPRAGCARRRPSPSRRRRRGRRVRVESPVRSAVRGRGRPDRLAHPRARRDDAGHAAEGPRRRARPRRRQARDPEGAPRDPARCRSCCSGRRRRSGATSAREGRGAPRPDVVGQDRPVARAGRAAPRAGSPSGRAQRRLASGVPLHGHRHEQDRAVATCRGSNTGSSTSSSRPVRSRSSGTRPTRAVRSTTCSPTPTRCPSSSAAPGPTCGRSSTRGTSPAPRRRVAISSASSREARSARRTAC